MRHIIENRLLCKRVNIALIGVGGIGSTLLSSLAKIHSAILELGHPGGLMVTAYDSDEVSPSNIGRQQFSPADLNVNKAVLSIHRINQFFSLDWKAQPVNFTESTRCDTRPDIIISCVDTRQARRKIHKYASSNRVDYWMDCGNLLASGQVILGQPKHFNDTRKERLPCVTELFPEILDKKITDGDDLPSCSMAEAMSRQDLFIGAAIALSASDILWKLFRQGGLQNHGAFVNLTSGTANPLPVDSEAWKRIMPQKIKKARLCKAA